MKTFLFSLLLAVFLIIGCADNFDNTLVSTPITTEKVTSRTSSNPSTLNSSVLNNNEIYRIPIFKSRDELKASKLINGETGGEAVVETTYVNYQGREIYVYASIEVSPSTFQGTTKFTMILHPEEASIELFPHMVFDKIVKVWVWFEGIDLEPLGYSETGPVDFAFFADDGSIELIPSQLSHVNISTQTIKVQNAQLNHFSRYGWSR